MFVITKLVLDSTQPKSIGNKGWETCLTNVVVVIIDCVFIASAKDLGLDDLNKATSGLASIEEDSETAKLAAERAKTVKELQETAKRNHEERMAREAAAADKAKAAEKAFEDKADAMKAAAKRPAAKSTKAKAASKPAAKAKTTALLR